ncbi:hypothetical protein DPMN_093732 [Dreissena polymorpha]|uniref:F-box domain-containing protein n=2 Tax=Dreissena polymorpha TaxID=45954 RepID=A0A9D4R268_DREPO|nr:hypothetical protein DPMN_093732 [Dreissena polymorpha]
MPDEIIEGIMSYLSFHEASEARRVCKLFNRHCQQKLNRGFSKIDKLHGQIQKEVKNKLPRRESERRNHPLARHVDILSAIETRLSLLGMSYSKYIDSGLCCFIPGKVLDELHSILYRLQSSDQPPRSHEFLQELRDISSMAMEHFDEKIAPGLKSRLPTVNLPYPFSDPCTSSTGFFQFPTTTVRTPSMRSEVVNLGIQVRGQTSNVQQVKRDMSEIRNSYTYYKKRIFDQDKKIAQQNRTICELEKKVNDLNQKFNDLATEFQKLRENQDSGDSRSSGPCLAKEGFQEEFIEDVKVSCTVKNKALKRKSGTSGRSTGVKKSRK